MLYPTEKLRQFPALRRFLSIGFRHIPTRDAPHYGMVCLESKFQRVFIVPETGYLRVGRNLVT